jgi:hypothetical protein
MGATKPNSSKDNERRMKWLKRLVIIKSQGIKHLRNLRSIEILNGDCDMGVSSNKENRLVVYKPKGLYERVKKIVFKESITDELDVLAKFKSLRLKTYGNHVCKNKNCEECTTLNPGNNNNCAIIWVSNPTIPTANVVDEDEIIQEADQQPSCQNDTQVCTQPVTPPHSDDEEETASAVQPNGRVQIDLNELSWEE